MEERKDSVDRGDSTKAGPMDPTRKLLKVFGVKVTDYEAKSDALLGRWPGDYFGFGSCMD